MINMLFTHQELEKYMNENTIKGVVHVGAHICEELEYYKNTLKLKNEYILWIEANPPTYSYIKNTFPEQNIVHALCTDVTGKKYEFMVTVNSQNHNHSDSSSIFKFGTHATEHPQVKVDKYIELESTKLDDIMVKRNIYFYNMLNLDVQGAELLVCKGAEKMLKTIDYIYTEVNEKELYIGCCLINELDTYLEKFGFVRKLTKMTEHGWGDALYVKSSLEKPSVFADLKNYLPDMTYDDIKDQYELYANKLIEVVKYAGEPIEGNIYTLHNSFDINPLSEPKRRNLCSWAKNRDIVLEIGLGSGHSSLVFLLANPKCVVYAIDDCKHVYTKLCFQYLRQVFGERIYLLEGNSNDILSNVNFETRPTLYHLDGSIIYEVVKKDMENCCNISKKGDIIIMDDIDIFYISKLWYDFIGNETIKGIDKPYYCNPRCDHLAGIKT